MKAVIIMATPCAKSLGGEIEGHKRQRGCEGRNACWKFATYEANTFLFERFSNGPNPVGFRV